MKIHNNTAPHLAGLVLAGLVLAVGCSETRDVDPDRDGGRPADAGPRVDGDLALDADAPPDADPSIDASCALRCDGVCTDTQTDPLHCGSCGHPCPAPDNGEATCEEGVCGVQCAPGYDEVADGCGPGLPPRPIAPLSTATATSRRPTFRWELTPSDDGARIEICADRGCTSVLETIDASGTSGRPAADLPSGVVFWRLYGRRGADVGTAPSPTWQLYLHALSAPVDTSWSTTLDVNGDGFADVLVGAWRAFSDAGRAYLYLGGASGLATSPIVLDNGAAGGFFGRSVASAGDVDGDGYGDVIIGARATRSGGRAYLFRGGASGLAIPPIVLDNGADGGGFGVSVASAGDVDGDGYGDVIIGASQAEDEGRAYVFRGGASGLTTAPIVLDNGADGGGFGGSVASAGDVDGDGYAEVVVGAGTAPGGGRAYLFVGGASGLSTGPIVLGNGTDRGQFGASVASAGDPDGDGYADVIVGAPWVAGSEGRAYLFRGGASGLSTSRIVLENGSAGGEFGLSVASAGDVDGDGHDDVVIGASIGGRVYLFRGAASSVVAWTPLVLEVVPDNRFLSGFSVAGAGDVDGDGYADVVVGARAAAGASGRAYVFQGGASGLSTTPTVLHNGAVGGFFGGSVARLELRWSLPARRVRGESRFFALLGEGNGPAT